LDGPKVGYELLGFGKKGIAWIGDNLDAVTHLDQTGPLGSVGAGDKRVQENQGREKELSVTSVRKVEHSALGHLNALIDS
jgi:hypothetical protein